MSSEKSFRVVSVLSALLMLATCMRAQSQPPVPSGGDADQQRHHQTAGDQEARSEGGQAVKPLPVLFRSDLSPIEVPPRHPTRPTDHEQQAKQEPTKHWWGIPDWWMVGCTIVLVFIAAAQAVLFVWQLGLMRTNLRDSKIAANAAKESADTAKGTLEIMKSTAEKQLRAYVRPFPFNVQRVREGLTPIISVRLANVGQTPAYQVETRVDVITSAAPIGTDFDLPEIRTGWSVKSDLFPNLIPDKDQFTPNLPAGAQLTADQVVGIRKRTLVAYIIGEVRYKDVFGYERHSRFCSGIGGTDDELEKLTTTGGGAGVSISLASVGNTST